MAKCTARIFSDEANVNIDMSAHSRSRPPDVFECVWPKGHERGGTAAPTHHSSATAVWDDPDATDQTVLTDEQKAQRVAELKAELAQLGGK